MIAANLSAGDAFYKEPFSHVVNATLTRRYIGVEREVNYYGQRGNYTSSYPRFQQVSEMDVYWDKATSILDEWIHEIEYTRLEQGFVTYMFTYIVIKETNVWESTHETIVGGKSTSVKPQNLTLWAATTLLLLSIVSLSGFYFKRK